MDRGALRANSPCGGKELDTMKQLSIAQQEPLNVYPESESDV